MNIENRIDEYFKKNEKKIIKEDIDIGVEEYDMSDDVFDLLNGLDDNNLSDDQKALKEKILSKLAPETTMDFDDEEFEDEFNDLDDNLENEVNDFPLDTNMEADITGNLGNKEWYGYDEDDINIADGKKYKKGKLISEGTKKKKDKKKKGKGK